MSLREWSLSIDNNSQLIQPHAIRKIKDSWWDFWDTSLLSWDLNVHANHVSIFNGRKYSLCEVTFSIIPGSTLIFFQLTWSAAKDLFLCIR
jgi:hypothetical protein